MKKQWGEKDSGELPLQGTFQIKEGRIGQINHANDYHKKTRVGRAKIAKF